MCHITNQFTPARASVSTHSICFTFLCFQRPPPSRPLMDQATAGVHALHRVVLNELFLCPRRKRTVKQASFLHVTFLGSCRGWQCRTLQKKSKPPLQRNHKEAVTISFPIQDLKVYHPMRTHWNSIQNHTIKKMNLCCRHQRFVFLYQEMCEFPQARMQIYSFAD